MSNLVQSEIKRYEVNKITIILTRVTFELQAKINLAEFYFQQLFQFTIKYIKNFTKDHLNAHFTMYPL